MGYIHKINNDNIVHKLFQSLNRSCNKLLHHLLCKSKFPCQFPQVPINYSIPFAKEFKQFLLTHFLRLSCRNIRFIQRLLYSHRNITESHCHSPAVEKCQLCAPSQGHITCPSHSAERNFAIRAARSSGERAANICSGVRFTSLAVRTPIL